MIYDKPIDLLKLPDGVGSPLQGKLIAVESAYCAELEVYHGRFWEAQQAGVRIDTMVEIPLHRPAVSGGFVYFRDHVYAIEQAQFASDADQLPVTRLTLRRMEGFYDIASPS